jgi:hypothetical protein
MSLHPEISDGKKIFRSVVTRFLNFQNCAHIIECYYYCYAVYLYLFQKLLHVSTLIFFLHFSITHNLKISAEGHIFYS